MVTPGLVNAEAHNPTAYIVNKLRSQDLVDRASAIEEVLRDESVIRDPRVQEALIKLINTETTSKDWGALDEYAPYQRYYFSLMRTIEHVAVDYHQQSAWKELVLAHYGEDSEFAQKLAEHEEAIRAALQFTIDVDDGVRSRGLSFLSHTLASCHTTSTRKTCSLINAKAGEIMKLLRAGSTDDSSLVRAKSIWGLGICGGPEDALYLESLIKPNSSSSFIQLARISAKNIRRRTEQEGKSDKR